MVDFTWKSCFDRGHWDDWNNCIVFYCIWRFVKHLLTVKAIQLNNIELVAVGLSVKSSVKTLCQPMSCMLDNSCVWFKYCWISVLIWTCWTIYEALLSECSAPCFAMVRPESDIRLLAFRHVPWERLMNGSVGMRYILKTLQILVCINQIIWESAVS